MIERFAELWNKHKNKLEDRLTSLVASDEVSSYEELLRYLITDVLNQSDNYYDHFQTDDIVSVDFGNYSGTLIMIFHVETYDPSIRETFYTSVEYGSCSVCDALRSIQVNSDGEEKVQEYMQLSLNLLQSIRCFKEED